MANGFIYGKLREIFAKIILTQYGNLLFKYLRFVEDVQHFVQDLIFYMLVKSSDPSVEVKVSYFYNNLLDQLYFCIYENKNIST